MGVRVEDLLGDTPFIAVDLDVMERNIHSMAKLSQEANVKLRPHTKTHKSTYIAKMQIEAGACGITTAKLGEAEIMAEAGIDDILIAFPIMGKKKLERFARLLQKCDLKVALDDPIVAQGINDVGESLKRKIPIYIDVDTGLGRMGRSPKNSISPILELAKFPYIEIKGLMSHAGHAYSLVDEERVRSLAIEDAALLYETKLLLEKKGIDVEEISVGTTATARFLRETPYITEARPGMYVFNDRNVVGVGGAALADCAVSIYATVVSMPSQDRLIIDAGSKTLALDLTKGPGYGIIKGHENLILKKLFEEHGIVEIQGTTSLHVGDVVEIIPNHVCPVINLADEIYGLRKGGVEKIISIDCRGRSR